MDEIHIKDQLPTFEMYIKTLQSMGIYWHVLVCAKLNLVQLTQSQFLNKIQKKQ